MIGRHRCSAVDRSDSGRPDPRRAGNAGPARREQHVITGANMPTSLFRRLIDKLRPLAVSAMDVDVPAAAPALESRPDPPPSASAVDGRAAAAAERARIRAILGHPAAIGRFPLAAHLALETDHVPDFCIYILRASERERPEFYLREGGRSGASREAER